MSSISVVLSDGEDTAPTADVLTLDDGRRFISLRFGLTATVLLPGFDIAVAEYARAVAKALIHSADIVDRMQGIPPNLAAVAEGS